MQTLIDAISEELIRTKTFLLQPATGHARNIRFLSDGGIEDNSGDVLVNNWKLSLDNYKVGLRLYADETFRAFLHLSRFGDWSGRDRASNGTVCLKPTLNQDKWLVLANPLKFKEQFVMDDSEKEFRYLETLPQQIDWRPYRFDIRKTIDTGLLVPNTTAIGIAAYDRPFYFKQVVQSLAQNKSVREYPIFIFMDKCDDVVMGDQIEVALSLLPHSIIIKRPRNFGCGRNLIDLRRQLFDYLGYDEVFVFEDDMVVSSDYLDLTVKMFDWAQRNYDNVGAVQCWNECKLSLETKKYYQRSVRATFNNWWGYLLSRKAWNTFKDSLYKYEELFLGGEYKYRPHRSIHSWFDFKKRRLVQSLGTEYPLVDEFIEERKLYLSSSPTGQDGATATLFNQAGWTRLCTTVKRGK